MANYETLKAAIQQVVKTNGNNEITGALLQQSLLSMINSLVDGFQFMGIATPSTNPGTPDQNIAYLAGPGVYSNFGSATVPFGCLAILKYNGSWTIEIDETIKNYVFSVIGSDVDTVKSYMSGTTVFIKAYNPVKTLDADTKLEVIDITNNSSSLSVAFRRGGTTLYRNLTKDGNKYTFDFVAGDEIVNIFAADGVAGRDYKISYTISGGIFGEISELNTKINDILSSISTITTDLDKTNDDIAEIKTIIGFDSEEEYIGYNTGTINYVVAYSPIKQISRNCKISVKLINSSATGISLTISRNSSTQYITMQQVSDDEFSYDLLANDSVYNIFTNGGIAGNTYKVTYSYGEGILNDLEELENGLSSVAGSLYKSGKTWMAIGDSLTAESTLGAGVKNYVNYVSERLNITAINKGVSGTGYWKGHTTNNAFYQRIPNYTEQADVITIFGSFNDLGVEDGISGGNIIGTYLDNTTETLGGCINKTLDNLIAKYPNALIGIVSPTPWSNSHESSNPESYVNLLRQIAEYRSIPFLDLSHSSNLHPWDASFRQLYYKTPDDGAHPNTNGHKRFSGFFANFVADIIY